MAHDIVVATGSGHGIDRSIKLDGRCHDGFTRDAHACLLKLRAGRRFPVNRWWRHVLQAIAAPCAAVLRVLPIMFPHGGSLSIPSIQQRGRAHPVGRHEIIRLGPTRSHKIDVIFACLLCYLHGQFPTLFSIATR